MKVYVVMDGGYLVGVYTNEETAKKVTENSNRNSEMAGGYPHTHYKEAEVKEAESEAQNCGEVVKRRKERRKGKLIVR